MPNPSDEMMKKPKTMDDLKKNSMKNTFGFDQEMSKSFKKFHDDMDLKSSRKFSLDDVQKVVLENKQVKKNVEEQKKQHFRVESVISEQHAFDTQKAEIEKQLEEDKKTAGGDMDAADYMALQSDEMQIKLNKCDNLYKGKKYSDVYGYKEFKTKSFREEVMPKETLKLLQDLDVTKRKQITEVEEALKTAVKECEKITGKALQGASDEFCEYTNVKSMREKLEKERQAYEDNIQYFGKSQSNEKKQNARKAITGEKFDIDDSLIIQTKSVDNQNVNFVFDLRLFLENSYFYQEGDKQVPYDLKYVSKLDENGQEIEKHTEQEKMQISAKYMGDFCKRLDENMAREMLQFCKLKYGTSLDKGNPDNFEGMVDLVVAMGAVAEQEKIKLPVETREGLQIKELDVSEFVKSAPVKRMLKLREYATELQNNYRKAACLDENGMDGVGLFVNQERKYLREQQEGGMEWIQKETQKLYGKVCRYFELKKIYKNNRAELKDNEKINVDELKEKQEDYDKLQIEFAELSSKVGRCSNLEEQSDLMKKMAEKKSKILDLHEQIRKIESWQLTQLENELKIYDEEGLEKFKESIDEARKKGLDEGKPVLIWSGEEERKKLIYDTVQLVVIHGGSLNATLRAAIENFKKDPYFEKVFEDTMKNLYIKAGNADLSELKKKNLTFRNAIENIVSDYNQVKGNEANLKTWEKTQVKKANNIKKKHEKDGQSDWGYRTNADLVDVYKVFLRRDIKRDERTEETFVHYSNSFYAEAWNALRVDGLDMSTLMMQLSTSEIDMKCVVEGKSIDISDESVRKYIDPNIQNVDNTLSLVIGEAWKAVQNEVPGMENVPFPKEYDITNILSGEKTENKMDNAIITRLGKNPVWEQYRTFASLLKQTKGGIQGYKQKLEEVIVTNLGVDSYYSEIQDVKKYLKNCQEKLNNSRLDNFGLTDTYKEVQNLKDEFWKLSEEKWKYTGTTKENEREKIENGKKVYDALAKYDQLKDKLSKNLKLRDTPQGRKIMESLYDMRDGICQSLIEKKDVELAYYEGSLLNQDLKEMNSVVVGVVQGTYQLTNADNIKGFVNKSESIRKSLEAYLQRYSTVEGRCFYVRNLQMQYDILKRRSNKAVDLMTRSICKEVEQECKLDEKHLLTHNATVPRRMAELKRKYSSEEGRVQDEKEIQEYLTMIFDTAVVTKALTNPQNTFANVKSYKFVTEPVKNEGAPEENQEQKSVTKIELDALSDPYVNNIFASLTDKSFNSVFKVPANSESAKKWFQKMSEGLIATYQDMISKFKEKTANIADSDMKEYYSDYLVGQTKISEQMDVLNAIAKGIGIAVEGDELSEYLGKIKTAKEKISKNFGADKDNKKRKQDAELEAFEALTMNNNIESFYEDQANAIRSQLKQIETEEDKKRKSEIEKKNKKENQNKEKSVENEINSDDWEKLQNVSTYRMALEGELEYIAGTIEKADWSEQFEKLYKAVEKLRNAEDAAEKDAKALGNLPALYQSVQGFAAAYIEKIHKQHWVAGPWSKAGKKRLAFAEKIQTMMNARVKVISGKLLETTGNKLKTEQENVKNLKSLVDEYETYLDELSRKKVRVTIKDFNNFFNNTKLRDKGLEGINLDTFAVDNINTREGIKLRIKLEKFKNQAYENSTDMIIDKAQALQKECFTMEPEEMSLHDRMKLGIKCYNFANENRKCFEDAKSAVNLIEEIGKKYFDSENCRLMINKMDTIAKGLIKLKGQEPKDLADMERFMYLYGPYLDNVKVEDGELFMIDYGRVIDAYKTIKQKLSANKINDKLRKQMQAQAKKNLDARLNTVRKNVSNNNLISGTDTEDIVESIKDAIRELAYYNEYYLKEEKKGVEEIEKGYYIAQRENLKKLLASYAVRDMVTDEKKEMDDAKESLTVEKRLAKFKADHTNAETKVERSDVKYMSKEDMKDYIKYIVKVDWENAQLGGTDTLERTLPQMTKELKEQLEVKETFEKSLKSIQDEKRETLYKALDDVAGSYYKVLDEKLSSARKYQLDPNQTLLMEYFISFTKPFEEAKGLLSKIKDWKKFKIRKGSSVLRLEAMINLINCDSELAINANGLKVENKEMLNALNSFKKNVARSRYATDAICNERDQNFAHTLRNLGARQVRNAEEFKENEEIIKARKFYNKDEYKKRDITDSWYIRLSEKYLVSTKHSLGDYIERLDNIITYGDYRDIEKNKGLSKQYGETLGPIQTKLKRMVELAKEIGDNEVFKLQDVNKIPEGEAREKEKDARRKKQEERQAKIMEFRGLVENIDQEFDRAVITSKATHKTWNKMFGLSTRMEMHLLMLGWKDFYKNLVQLPGMIESYADRNPYEQEKKNSVLEEKRKKFNSAIKEAIDRKDNVNQSGDHQHNFLDAVGILKMDEHAESSLEYRTNVECGTYSDYLMGWFENHCYERAEETHKAILGLKDDNKEEWLKLYKDFMTELIQYDMGGGISKEAYNTMKNYVLGAISTEKRNAYNLKKTKEKEQKKERELKVQHVDGQAHLEDVLSSLDEGELRAEVLKKTLSNRLMEVKDSPEVKTKEGAQEFNDLLELIDGIDDYKTVEDLMEWQESGVKVDAALKDNKEYEEFLKYHEKCNGFAAKFNKFVKDPLKQITGKAVYGLQFAAAKVNLG